MIQHAFYFTLKAILVKNGLNNFFKIYDIIAWLTNNCNTYIDHYLKK